MSVPETGLDNFFTCSTDGCPTVRTFLVGIRGRPVITVSAPWHVCWLVVDVSAGGNTGRSKYARPFYTFPFNRGEDSRGSAGKCGDPHVFGAGLSRSPLFGNRFLIGCFCSTRTLGRPIYIFHQQSNKSSFTKGLPMSDWAHEIATARELQPSHRRRVLATNNCVLRIALKPGERDHYGNTHDPQFTRLLDENLVLATEVVRKWTTVPVPQVIHYDTEITVLKVIKGVDLDAAWSRVSKRQLDGIKHELRGYIEQLWRIPNLSSEDFTIGTLCRTHEILFSSNREYPHQGPFKTTKEYRSHVPGLFGRTPRFPEDAQPVFDHMDWYQSNIILHPNLDGIAGIIDWEYAGYIPDPGELHRGDVPTEDWGRPEWADIFDGLEQPKSNNTM